MPLPVTREEVSKELNAQRPFYLTRSNIRAAAENIGYTPGCQGCRAVQNNFVSKPPHSPECRKRMEEEIKKTARGAERIADFENRLASDVEARIHRENKLAKTGSVGIEEKNTTTIDAPSVATPINTDTSSSSHAQPQSSQAWWDRTQQQEA